jgi:hypothetical protein
VGGRSSVNNRTIRRIWFAGLWFLMPWPMFILADALIPAVRYAILAGIVATVGIVESGSGPVLSIFVLFSGMAALTTLACWLLAWIIGRLLSGFTLPTQRTITWACLAAAILISLWFDPYQTPFGRASDGGLLDILS